MRTEPLSEAWVDAIIGASVDRPSTPGLNGVAAVTIGKTKRAVLEIVEGRAVAPTGADPEVEIPVTAKQIAAWADGELSLSVGYMQGDLKPVGPTGPLLAVLELLDDPTIRVAV